jgi:multiple antibiotic resistance protein
MTEFGKTLLLFVSALFPIIDPLGGSPIFLALTEGYSRGTRRALSLRIALNSIYLLMGSYLIGSHVLAFFGISLPVVQVSGGLLVTATGWAMLKQPEETERSEVKTSVQTPDALRRAFYPFTLPLTVGPGSISVAVTLGANGAPHDRIDAVAILAALVGSLLLALSIFVCYGFADRLASILGPTATIVVTRLSAFLLLCIGIQIMWNGISGLLLSYNAAAPSLAA